MGSLTYALSVHHFISTVGADAGFAALIGLAILIILYFAQAREAASLRQQVAHAARRVAQLEARLGASQRPPGPARAPAPLIDSRAAASGTMHHRETPAPVVDRQIDDRTIATSARLSASRGGAVTEPAAPAGVGAPPLAAATRLVPVGRRSTTSAGYAAEAAPDASRPSQGDDTVVGRLDRLDDSTEVGAPGALEDEREAGGQVPEEDQTAVAFLAPATAAAKSNGMGRDQGDDSFPGSGARAAAPAPLAPAPAASRAARPAPGPDGDSWPSSPAQASARDRRPAVLALAALLVAAVVVAIVALTSGSGPSHSSQAASKPAPKRPATQTVTINPRTVQVSVLNGTATAGLAHRIAMQLSSRGFVLDRTTNAATQTSTTTIVSYMPDQRLKALAVAQSLGLKASAVAPIDAGTKAIACPSPSACSTAVVVTAGADIAARS